MNHRRECHWISSMKGTKCSLEVQCRRVTNHMPLTSLWSLAASENSSKKKEAKWTTHDMESHHSLNNIISPHIFLKVRLHFFFIQKEIGDARGYILAYLNLNNCNYFYLEFSETAIGFQWCKHSRWHVQTTFRFIYLYMQSTHVSKYKFKATRKRPVPCTDFANLAWQFVYCFFDMHV